MIKTAQPTDASEIRDDSGQRVRILLVSGWSSCHGGSSIVLLQIAQHIDRSEFEPLVLCPEPGELPDRLSELGLQVELHRMTRLARTTSLQFLQDVVWYRRWLREKRIQVIHMMGLGWRRSVAAAARVCGIPYVVHIHNSSQPHWSDYSHRWASRIVANSHATAGPFLKCASTSKKTVTIYNGVDLSLYDQAANNRAELNASGRPVIGFVGHIIAQKGVRPLIESMPTILRTCPTALLVIVGCAPPDEPEYEHECRRVVTNIGLEEHVVFTGYRRDVPSWMKTFDVFVLPTRAEAFGIVNIEAMAAGCPVVASAVGGIPEIISRPDLGTLIAPDDPRAIANAIVTYIANPNGARQIGNAAAHHVRKHFSVESMVRRLQSVYHEVVAEHNHR